MWEVQASTIPVIGGLFAPTFVHTYIAVRHGHVLMCRNPQNSPGASINAIRTACIADAKVWCDVEDSHSSCANSPSVRALILKFSSSTRLINKYHESQFSFRWPHGDAVQERIFQVYSQSEGIEEKVCAPLGPESSNVCNVHLGGTLYEGAYAPCCPKPDRWMVAFKLAKVFGKD